MTVTTPTAHSLDDVEALAGVVADVRRHKDGDDDYRLDGGGG